MIGRLAAVAVAAVLVTAPARGQQSLGEAAIAALDAVIERCDAMAHLHAHPRHVDRWLAALPPFALRTLMAHATDPVVLWKAGRAYALRADETVRLPVVRALAARFAQGPLAPRFAALRVLAGDAAFTQAARAALTHPVAAYRLRDAVALAYAENPDGIAALRELTRTCGFESVPAARVLAWVDGAGQQDFLRATSRRCPLAGLRSAAGAARLAAAFPDFFEMIRRRDPMNTWAHVDFGLYDTWMEFVYHAEDDALTSLTSLFHAITRARFHDRYNAADATSWRRRMDAFADFVGVAIQYHKLVPAETFSENWRDATARMRTLQQQRGDKDDVAAVAAVIDAAVAVLRAAQRDAQVAALLAPRSDATEGLFYDAQYAADDDFRTGLYVTPGTETRWRFRVHRSVDTVWIALGCIEADDPGARIAVSGDALDKTHTLAGDHRWFQRIPLSAPLPPDTEVELRVAASQRTACVSEIRWQ